MIEAFWTAIELLNDAWQGGVEAVVGLIWLCALVAGLWYWWLPYYTAVVFHDGDNWLDLPGVWSASRGASAEDIEPFTKYWAARTLNEGKLLSPGQQLRLPVNPKVRRYDVQWWGSQRGIYRVISVRVFDPDILARYGRVDRPVFEWEQADEELPLR